jgi:hypothetical protein
MSENFTAKSAACLSDQQQCQTLYLQLRQCIDANSSGGSNPDALNRIRAIGLDLKRTYSLFSEKVDSLICWAEILYSPRRHTRWNSSYQSGVEAIAHFMRCDLGSIGDILSRISETS